MYYSYLKNFTAKLDWLGGPPLSPLGDGIHLGAEGPSWSGGGSFGKVPYSSMGNTDWSGIAVAVLLGPVKI